MTSKPNLLLDTHVWLHYLEASKALWIAAIAAIDEAALRYAVFVSVISIWEIAMLERAGRIELTGGTDRWSQTALAQPGLESVNLPEPMHKDPADRILIASARVERMSLVTSDKAVLAFARSSGLAHVRA